MKNENEKKPIVQLKDNIAQRLPCKVHDYIVFT